MYVHVHVDGPGARAVHGPIQARMLFPSSPLVNTAGSFGRRDAEAPHIQSRPPADLVGIPSVRETLDVTDYLDQLMRACCAIPLKLLTTSGTPPAPSYQVNAA
jgi:hypothetical protein